VEHSPALAGKTNEEIGMKLIFRWGAFGLIIAAASVGALFSQNPGIQRTVVHKADVSVPGREAVIARVEIAPGARAGRHTHPGDEISYVQEGEGEILIEGQPPRNVKAGDGFVIPAGAKHDAHNTGSSPLKLVGVYVVEKGKPLATPAP
jgi:quercetin dioxygenase-like cupin family protein